MSRIKLADIMAMQRPQYGGALESQQTSSEHSLIGTIMSALPGAAGPVSINLSISHIHYNYHVDAAMSLETDLLQPDQGSPRDAAPLDQAFEELPDEVVMDVLVDQVSSLTRSVSALRRRVSEALDRMAEADQRAAHG